MISVRNALKECGSRSAALSPAAFRLGAGGAHG